MSNALATALLAPACAACDAVLDEPLAGCVCRGCWASIRPFTPPFCDACGDPLARPGACCGLCRHRERQVDRARAVGAYDGALRAIVHALKYERRRSVARPLARLMCASGSDMLTSAECAVPVPLHWRREYTRGFNQARELGRHLGLPIVDALVRRRPTRPQVELAAGERRANVSGAFAPRRRGWRASADVGGKIVLLVDDVSTTGATLDACAAALKAAGARAVWALTAARVAAPRPR